MRPSNRSDAFTLIELLIVVAIIAILAAIAVPNFLEAQTRSKISRTMADMRSLATSLEAYQVDCNHYPPSLLQPSFWKSEIQRLVPLTTPVAYIASIPTDTFQVVSGGTSRASYWDYSDREAVNKHIAPFNHPSEPWDTMWGNKPGSRWRLASNGPDRFPNQMGDFGVGVALSPNHEYDASNGTISSGDILRWGP